MDRKKCVVCKTALEQDRRFFGAKDRVREDGSHCPKCGLKYYYNVNGTENN